MTAIALPGPFRIHRIVEIEGPFREPEHIMPDAVTEAFAATAAARDPRFFEAVSGKLIMAFHSILVETPHCRMLIDSCIGNDKPRPRNPDWNRRAGAFLQDLGGLDLAPEDIDIVLCTHLHADHVGWNTRLLNGRWVPTFPRANYLFAREEFAHWQAERAQAADPDSVNHGSWEDSVQPIVDAGLHRLVDQDAEIAKGIRLVPAPGHSPGNVMVRLQDGDQTAYIIGDTLHHPVQVERPGWSTRFCWDPQQSAASRYMALAQLSGTGAWMIPAHFPTPTAVRIEDDSDGFRLSE